MRITEGVPRLLFVSNQVDDFLRYRMELVRKVQEAGYDVHVALPQEPGLEDIASQGVIVHIIHLQRMSTGLVDQIRYWVSLLQLYLRLRPTVVHHMCIQPVLYGGIAARVVGVPVVINTFYGFGYLFCTHTIKAHVLRPLVTVALRFALQHENHRVIVQNSADRDFLLSRFNLSSDHVVLIKGSGVDLSLFLPEAEPDGLPVVLMASRLLWTKGVKDFVSAAQVIRARGIKARFVLVGEPDRDHPSAIPTDTLKHWNDAGDIEWLGYQFDMPTVIAQSHIVCLPSCYGEGVPRILQEAAAVGRPAVATETPGCLEAVHHGQNGLIVPVGDIEALAEALAQLIGNSLLRRSMGNRGREIAVTEFSLDQVVDANLSVYRALLCSAAERAKSHSETIHS
ncbi:MAG: hypothetical protein A4E19_21285 [Nitrospira sp. SG-bin1]|nr:MAG: hypothetical protein A4E19_21285 [Nitrospira sp. SG-bin1]